MIMNRKFVLATLLSMIFGQLALGDSPKTFEEMAIAEAKKLKGIPAAAALSEKLSSLTKSKELIELLSSPEEMQDIINLGNISKACKTDVEYAVTHFDQWTKNMLDATAKPPPGLQYLAFNWIGSFQQCYSNPPGSKDNKTSSHYCRATFGTRVTMLDTTPMINVGFCVPESCSATDVRNFFTLVLDRLSEILPNASSLPTLANEDNVYCWKRQNEMKFSTAAIGMLFVCGLFGFFIFVGTLYDLFVYQPNVKLSQSLSVPINATNGEVRGNAMPGSDTSREEDSGGDFKYESLHNEESKLQSSVINLRLREKILLSFSFYSNGVKILDTKQQPGRLNCLDGIRFLSMSWVILGHSYFFAPGIINNLGYIMPLMMKRWTYEAIVNATFSVDSFFVLSGLLTAYMFLKEADRIGTIKSRKFWLLYFLHRFWRLTPPYMLFLGFYTALFPYMSNGPFWPQDKGIDASTCENNWWTNFLYVNNIVRSKAMCMGWSWYLANDMQFHYVVAPAILALIFLARRLRNGSAASLCFAGAMILSVAWILVSLISVGVVSSKNHFGPSLSGHNLAEAFDKIYVKPWTRVGAYIVGILTGYLIYEQQKRNWKLHPALSVVGWLMATGVCLAVLYGLAGYNNGSYKMSNDVAAFYNCMCRFAWSIGLAWLIFACLAGVGGWINEFLSWPGFIPLSRLTYCAYLVHPVVIMFFYLSMQSSPVVDSLNVVYWFFGHMVAAYMVAFVLSAVCESPLIGLERILLKKQ